MAVTFDAKSNPVMDSTSSGAVVSFTNSTSITVANNANRALILELCCGGTPGAGVTATWNGVSMTQLAFRQDAGVNVTTYVFGLRAPATGTQTLSVDFNGSTIPYVASLTSLYNVVQTNDATAFQHVTTAEGSSAASSVTVTSTAGNMVVAAHTAGNGVGGQSFSSTNQTNLFTGTSLNNAGAGNRAAGASSLTMTGAITASIPWVSIGIDVQADAAPPTGGGTPTDAGTIFKRIRVYQSFTQPVVFAAAPLITGWFNSLSIPIRPRIFLQQEDQQALGSNSLSTDNVSWLRSFDVPVVRKTFPIPDWRFLAPPAQVFFPTAPWDDFVRRQRPPLDTQPLAFVSVVVQAAQQVWYPPNTWPDFAPKARSAIDTNWLAFTPSPDTATTIGDWPDFVRRKPQPLDTQPLIWAAQPIAVQQVWFPYDPWPSLIAKKPVPLNFNPATPFIQTPAQVFFPYGPWDDFARRKPVAQDTQRFAWSNFIPAPTFFLVPDRWPDLIYKKPVSLNYVPLTFLQTVTSPYNSFVNWPDFATKKRPPLNYEPLTYLQLVRTPWNELSRWPELVPIRGRAGLHAALQQFAARFPGVITQATITGILNAFEVNSDVASITILVRQSGPAVRAAVSIQEIGTI